MKALAAGSEIDAWCTWCRLDLGHRIVAMVGGAPKRVICQTCGKEHDYRAPRTGRGARGAVVVRRGGELVTREGPKRPATAGVRAAEKARVEKERYDAWASRALGRTPDAYTRYAMDRKLEPGQLVLHPKFGEGYVEAVLEDGKAVIMFRDGPKTLAQAR